MGALEHANLEKIVFKINSVRSANLIGQYYWHTKYWHYISLPIFCCAVSIVSTVHSIQYHQFANIIEGLDLTRIKVGKCFKWNLLHRANITNHLANITTHPFESRFDFYLPLPFL